MVYFTSDLHFGHKNLCTGLRGMTAEDCAELIISNWNKVVTKRDLVYVLGDVSMEDPKSIAKYVPRLNGRIIVSGGNHDDRKCCEMLSSLGITVTGSIKYKGFICTHIPVHQSELVNWRGNLHGHLHLSGEIEGIGRYQPQELTGRYFNVNCEFHNYTPVNFDHIINHFKNL